MKRILGVGVVGLAALAAGAWAMPGMGHRMSGMDGPGCAMQGATSAGHGGMRGGMHGGMQHMAAMHGAGGMTHRHGGPAAPAPGQADRPADAGACPMHGAAGHAGCAGHNAGPNAPAKP
jgi:hypothetical protein